MSVMGEPAGWPPEWRRVPSADIARDPVRDYFRMARVVGGVSFVAAWIYSVLRYGWFLGIGLGWLPALCIGAVAGLLWPLLVVAVVLAVVALAVVWRFGV